MNEKRVSYYLVRAGVIAKRENDGGHDSDYLFEAGKWVKDSGRGVMGRLTEADRISEEQAISIMNQQILELLKNKWKEAFAAQKAEWDKNPRWPAKLVKTKFCLNGVKYTLFPPDVGLTYNCWDQGFMELIQADIDSDLEEYGATEIHSMGFID